MMNRLINYISAIEAGANRWRTYFLRAGLVGFAWLHIMIHWSYRDQFWGEAVLQTMHRGTDTWWSLLLNLCTRGYVGYEWMLGGIIVGGILSFLTNWGRVGAIIFYLSTVNLLRLEVSFSTAGHHLLLILLFWNCLVTLKPRPTELNRFISGLGYFGMQIQVAVLYLVTGLVKIVGEQWLTGMAVTTVFGVDEFTHPLLMDWSAGGVAMVLGYGAMAYQILFPILVWRRSLKIYLLPIGVLFHAFIGWMMGIWEFSLIMMISYIVFIPVTQPNHENHPEQKGA